MNTQIACDDLAKSKSEQVQIGFREVPVQLITYAVRYLFSEVFIQLVTHSVRYLYVCSGRYRGCATYIRLATRQKPIRGQV